MFLGKQWPEKTFGNQNRQIEHHFSDVKHFREEEKNGVF